MVWLMIILIFFILYLFITYIMFLMVSKNNKNKMPMLKEVIKTLEPYQEMIAIGQKWMDDKLNKKQVKDVYITSSDGLKLHAILINHPNSKGFFLECHGYKSTAQRDLYPSCYEYYNMGYSLLITDNRACGLSEGKYVTFGKKESEDVLCWIKYLNKAYPKQKIILAGVSMGATSILLALKNITPKMHIKCALVDSGYVSAYDEVLYCVKHYFHLPGKLFIPMINFWCRTIAKFSLKETNATLLPNKLKVPILFIHGTEDDFVLCENTKINYEKYDGPKEMVLFEKASHGISYLVDSHRYLEAIKRTINKKES